MRNPRQTDKQRDEKFAAAYQDALKLAGQTLEDEVIRRRQTDKQRKPGGRPRRFGHAEELLLLLRLLGLKPLPPTGCND